MVKDGTMKKKTLCNCDSCRSGRCGICRDALYKTQEDTEYEKMPAIDHGLIRSEKDIMKLNIIDWKRFNPWPDPQAALQTIFSWFDNAAHYTVFQHDMEACPKREDFPGWHHAGNHESSGEMYWNWFHYWHGDYGDLHFSDSPDFYGSFHYPDEKIQHFWGDIGQCSAQAFARAQKQMSDGDLWISIKGTHKQVVIESHVDILGLSEHEFNETNSKKLEAQAIGTTQLTLF
jgi:hypothetical protein